MQRHFAKTRISGQPDPMRRATSALAPASRMGQWGSFKQMTKWAPRTRIISSRLPAASRSGLVVGPKKALPSTAAVNSAVGWADGSGRCWIKPTGRWI
jgi:hypothetical protein